jgi:hypothetical protein
MRPVCVACKRFYRCKKNGVLVHHQNGEGGDYQVWSADLYVCEGCGKEIIAGFGKAPVASCFSPDFEQYKAYATHEVNG